MTQRIIKFRGLSVEKGNWVYGFYVVLLDDEKVRQAYIFSEDGIKTHVHWETVTQFTGLLDKNGKEIYEGDIVKRYSEINTEFGFDLVVVQWNLSRCYFELQRGNNLAHYWGALHKDLEPRLEVIGNIYENPELLTPPHSSVSAEKH